MTHPPASPPPSADLSWELFVAIEAIQRALSANLVEETHELLLCRTIRSLCAERDRREAISAEYIAATDPLICCEWHTADRGQESAPACGHCKACLMDKLSAYVTAAEGRPASELVAPSGVARIIEARDNATDLAEARYKPLLAERDAEIERLKAKLLYSETHR